MKKGFIYYLKCPKTGQIRYIGQTKRKSINLRLNMHIQDAKRGKVYHNANWIRQLISEGMKPTIHLLEETSLGDLDEREIYWIKTYRENGYNLTNQTDGGFGHTGFIQSKETRKKRSESMKKLAQEGFYDNPERSKKLSVFNKGKTIPQEMRDRIANTLRGRPLAEETIVKLRQGKVKSVDIFTGEETTYNCLSEAARILNVNRGPISNVINGKQKTAYKKKWYKIIEDIVDTQ